jgi:hypothetical protein
MSAGEKELFRDGARIFAPRRAGRLGLRRTQSIICGREGFSVATERFWRSAQQDYRWDQVKWTEYSWRETGNRAGATFAIYASPLPPVYVREEQIEDFGGLIEIFNIMTPQLDHTWEVSPENSGVGKPGAPRGRYEKVYRAGMAPWERAITEDPSRYECCRCGTQASYATPEGWMCDICYIESR